mmetsp:Transcript_27768/g.60894  ORF Transcript_27768/g.60894 Transcript_27768/m.60894 type:complete len:377 (+) Transcript_27768:362-1492(+)|eukprot:CAMPEP_0178488264 /NCGR_PEP_ID=MMETSP0696-20121128/9766_1 /TAXON_ID=265572 /ORGANISM="Extubocellulus spinifer, Strain CCMP396" /LENGTH=376 /DNA_ID=CAMNT_0020116019 /DNA_START=289 /DNA_END=1419 /DNA_ORIENTATION=+
MVNAEKKRKVAPTGRLTRSKCSVSVSAPTDNANDDGVKAAAAAADNECSASTACSRPTLTAVAAPTALPTAAKKRKAGGLLATSDSFAADGKYSVDSITNAMVVGPALASLPSTLQLGILSYCDVPSLNVMMNSSPMFTRMAQSDEVWEGNLKRLLESTFDYAFGHWRREEDSANPPTKISLRPDWRCSTAFRKWHDECTSKGAPVDADTAFGPVQRGLAVRSNFTHYDMEIPKPTVSGGQRIWKTTTYAGSYLPEHHKWVWKDVKLMHYYRSAATFAAAGVSYRMRRAANSIDISGTPSSYCPRCFLAWRKHRRNPHCQGDRGLLSTIFNGLPLIRIFDVNALDSYRFGCGDDLSYQMYNIYITPPAFQYWRPYE